VKRKWRRSKKFFYRIIAERALPATTPGSAVDVASRSGRGRFANDDRQLRDEAITLFLAGHETTGQHTFLDVVAVGAESRGGSKAAAELDAVLGDRAPSLDDLPGLAYTGHVITESLRLYPAAWGLARLVVEDHEIAG